MSDDRDRQAPKHARLASIPAIVDDEQTAPHATPLERAVLRARRPTDERIGRLEQRVDTHGETLASIRGTVGELRGGVTSLLDFAARADAAREARAARELEETKARAELLDRAARRRALVTGAVIKIVVPALVAIGGIVTAIVGTR